MHRFSVPAVKGGDQLITPRNGIENPDKVGKERLPGTQFAFMHEIDD